MIPLKRALPTLGLIRAGSPMQLTLERPSWDHLLAYVEKVASLPADPDSASAATREAIGRVRDALEAVGSPEQLDLRLSRDPTLLAQKQPPDGIYAGILWLARRLHVGAAAMAGLMQTLEHSESLPGTAWKTSLLQMGSVADGARSGIAALAPVMKTTPPRLLAANDALVLAYEADARLLQNTYEALGALKSQVDHVQKQLRELSWLGSLARKAPLERQLRSLQSEQARNLTQVETLGPLIGQLAAVLDEGAWLAPALRDVGEFVTQVSKLWTQVGSGLSQLAADASSQQLEDPAWMRAALGLEDAVQSWRAICAAAEQFVTAALRPDAVALELQQSLVGSDQPS